MATVDKQQGKETIKKAVEQAKQRPKKEEQKSPEKKDEKKEEVQDKKVPPSEKEASLSALVEDTIVTQDTAKVPKLEELLPKYQPRDNPQKKDYQPAQEAHRPPQDAYQRPGEQAATHANDPKNQAYENPGQSYKAGHDEKKRDHPHHDPLSQIIEGYKK